jgi:hypothetical protein
LGEEVGQDLSYASSHFNALSLCSYENATAKELYVSLQMIFNDVREVISSPVYRAMREMNTAVKESGLVPPSHYLQVEGAKEISDTILDLTGRILSILQDSLNF